MYHVSGIHGVFFLYRKTRVSCDTRDYFCKNKGGINEYYSKFIDYWNFKLIEDYRLLNYNFSKKSAYIFVGAGDINKTFEKIIKK